MNLGNLKVTFSKLSEEEQLDLIVELRADRRISKVVVKAKRKKAGGVSDKQSVLELARGMDKKKLSELISKLEKDIGDKVEKN